MKERFELCSISQPCVAATAVPAVMPAPLSAGAHQVNCRPGLGTDAVHGYACGLDRAAKHPAALSVYGSNPCHCFLGIWQTLEPRIQESLPCPQNHCEGERRWTAGPVKARRGCGRLPPNMHGCMGALGGWLRLRVTASLHVETHPRWTIHPKQSGPRPLCNCASQRAPSACWTCKFEGSKACLLHSSTLSRHMHPSCTARSGKQAAAG